MNSLPNNSLKFMSISSNPSIIKKKEESYFNKNSQETENIMNQLANDIYLSNKNSL